MTTSDPLMKCPKDRAAMERLRVGSIEIDRCTTCGGVWLDAGELAAILAVNKDKGGALVGRIDDGAVSGDRMAHAIGAIRCPRDNAAMAVINDRQQRHVEYEMCPECGGVFLDAGELKDLSEFTLRERLASAFAK